MMGLPQLPQDRPSARNHPIRWRSSNARNNCNDLIGPAPIAQSINQSINHTQQERTRERVIEKEDNSLTTKTTSVASDLRKETTRPKASENSTEYQPPTTTMKIGHHPGLHTDFRCSASAGMRLAGSMARKSALPVGCTQLLLTCVLHSLRSGAIDRCSAMVHTDHTSFNGRVLRSHNSRIIIREGGSVADNVRWCHRCRFVFHSLELHCTGLRCGRIDNVGVWKSVMFSTCIRRAPWLRESLPGLHFLMPRNGGGTHKYQKSENDKMAPDSRRNQYGETKETWR